MRQKAIELLNVMIPTSDREEIEQLVDALILAAVEETTRQLHNDGSI